MTNQTIIQPSIQGRELSDAWNETLPQVLNASDTCTVNADEKNPLALIIHIDTEGRTKYSFDFRCTYADDREIEVELLDVEQDGIHVDEGTEIIQGLIRDYVRHFHECAQRLHSRTHA